MGYAFKDPSLLATALVHRSYTHTEGHGHIPCNERLEFLGDAVLNVLVAEHLYHTFPDKREGDLTKMKSRIVSRVALAEKAREFELGQYLLLGPGEEHCGGRSRTSIIADGFEALLGAMYLDGGAEAVKCFLLRHLLNDLERIISAEEHANYKSRLLEHCQGLGRGKPLYRVSRETGPDHEKEFTVVVEIENAIKGRGVGRTKREAEQRAAREALKKMGAIDGL